MPIFALVDCNNFYASCERLFKPELENKAVVVLSNNDGCIIARSNQAKALGIPMGAPFFKYKALCERHQVAVFSSNYQLYGDMSQRVMQSLQTFCPDMEIYSIDEAFLFLDKFRHLNLMEYAHQIRQKIKMWTGIPISIGIGPSKTLAKLANRIAKAQNRGVCDLSDKAAQQQALENCAVGDIWGIGHRLTEKLNRLGIKTAQQLCDYNPKILRTHFGVIMERTLLELKGISCIAQEEVKPKQSIISSRSFGKAVTEFEELSEAISNFVVRACQKLRQQNSHAQAVHVFIRTGLFNQNQPQYQNGITCGLAMPSADSCFIIHAAKQGLKKIYKPGYRYQKAGIVLLDIVPPLQVQQDLFLSRTHEKRAKIMQILDKINDNWGSNTLFLGAQGPQRHWTTRCDRQSGLHTTNWQQLVKVKI